MRFEGVTILKVQMKQLHRKIVFSAGSSVATNVHLGTKFIEKYFEKIRPKGEHYQTDEFKHRCDRRHNVPRPRPDYREHGTQGQTEQSAAEQPCDATLSTELEPMSETIVEVNTLAEVSY